MTMTEVRNAQAKKTRCEGPLEAAYITAVLSLPLRLRRKLDLLIDTDSTKKAVFDKDAITIGIPFEKLNKSMESLLGVGGLVDTYIVNDAKLHFKAQDNAEHMEEFRELLVVRHPASDSNIMKIPSVLGREISEQKPSDL
jgi:hypothetical protein